LELIFGLKKIKKSLLGINMRSNYLKIKNNIISEKFKPYCIAEVGINHNGNLLRALKMIDVAKEAGADAVKFQTFKAEELCSDNKQMFTYKSQGNNVTESMLKMFKRYELNTSELKEIKKYSEKKKITFFSTPQNLSDLKILKKIGIPAIKVGSDDFVNLPLISEYAKTKLPIILSCGMSDIGEVYKALTAVGFYNNYPVALLLCTSQYPTPPSDVNINKLTTLKNTFPGIILGFSDHTEGSLAASLAVSKGARIFEKHFTLDNNLPGPDHWFSANPKTLKDWVSSIHKAFEMLGSEDVIPTKKEMSMRIIARRSVVAIKNIKKNEKFSNKNIGMRRPGGGLPATTIKNILKGKSTRQIIKGDLIRIGDIDANKN
jgi:N,N'-diacetyllegionaminate synthase